MAENDDGMARLLAVMARLRDPQTGCPWDLQQDFSTIAPYTIEEAYEVADAIDRGDLPGLCDELGDLLLQVVFHARMAQEQGAFSFDDVVAAIVTSSHESFPDVGWHFRVPGFMDDYLYKLWRKCRHERDSRHYGISF